MKQEKKMAESAEVKTVPIPKKEKTPEERKLAYTQGIIKTVVASFIGVIAGFIAVNQFGTAEDNVWFAVLTIIGALSYYAQRLIYPSFKINTKEFGFKDWFYVEFLVIDFCLVTWTFLLN
jgi:predicted Co/Zn/Cd cation transporter (cation efflux family)